MTLAGEAAGLCLTHLAPLFPAADAAVRVGAEGYKRPARGDVRTPAVVCLQAIVLLRRGKFAADGSADRGRRKRLCSAPVLRNHPLALWGHVCMQQHSFAAHASNLYSNCVLVSVIETLFPARYVEAWWQHSCWWLHVK